VSAQCDASSQIAPCSGTATVRLQAMCLHEHFRDVVLCAMDALTAQDGELDCVPCRDSGCYYCRLRVLELVPL